MTRSKVLERLITFAPPLLHAHTSMPNHCVLATVTGLDTLRAFDIAAEPISVRAIVANRRYLANDRAGLAPVTNVAHGGHICDTGHETGVRQGMLWNGHLVIYLPALGHVLDLNLGAFSRPAKDIVLPPAYAFPFDPPIDSCTINGAHVEYKVWPDDVTWHESPDYRIVERRRPLVQRLVRAIRAGKLA